MKWRVGDYRARKYEGKHGMGKVEKRAISVFGKLGVYDFSFDDLTQSS